MFGKLILAGIILFNAVTSFASTAGHKMLLVSVISAPVNSDFNFDVINSSVLSGKFSTVTDQTITVNWGDGTNNTYSGVDQNYTHTYSSTGNYSVNIVGGATKITKFEMSQSGTNIYFNLSSLPSSLTSFICYGSNTITGNLSSLPSSLTSFICYGSNTITGDLSSLPSSLTSFICYGSNTITGYSGKTWASNQKTIDFAPVSGGLSSTEVDQLLADLDVAGGTWASPKTIKIIGVNYPRTSASDAAVASLATKGVTVTTSAEESIGANGVFACSWEDGSTELNTGAAASYVWGSEAGGSSTLLSKGTTAGYGFSGDQSEYLILTGSINSTDYLIRDITDTSTFGVRFAFYLDAGFTADDATGVLMLQTMGTDGTAPTGIQVRITRVAGVQTLTVYSYTSLWTSMGTYTLEEDIWYQIRIRWTNNTSGGSSWALSTESGGEVASGTLSGTTSVQQIDQIRFGGLSIPWKAITLRLDTLFAHNLYELPALRGW